ncbi:MAG: hypothetical protein ACRETM_10465 [Stenotrophobium sp.]
MKVTHWMRQLGLAVAPAAESGIETLPDVLDRHVIWKRNFEQFIRRGDGQATLAAHDGADRCPLQRWLASAESGPLGKNPLLASLQSEYTQFRDSITGVRQMMLDDQQAQAVWMIEHGNYARHSLRIKRLLIDLQLKPYASSPALAASHA